MSARHTAVDVLAQAHKRLVERLVNDLPAMALWQCAAKIGVPSMAWFESCTEAEYAALVDFTIHHYQSRGKNVIEHWLTSPAAPRVASDEGKLLRAMAEAQFEVFTAQEREAGYELRGRERVLVKGKPPAATLAGRVLDVGGKFFVPSLLPLSDEVARSLRGNSIEAEVLRRAFNAAESAATTIVPSGMSLPN